MRKQLYLTALTALFFLLESKFSFCQFPLTNANYGAASFVDANQGPVAFVIGNKAYCGTGNTYNPQEFWEYDPATDAWTRKADFPGANRLRAVAFSIGNKGYIGSGQLLAGGLASDFWEYDPASNTWTQKADIPTGRRSAVGFSINNKGYVGTGTTATSLYTADFWEFDPVANTWAQKADFPGSARRAAAGFALSGRGYLGTGQITGNVGVKDFWEFDPAANSWLQKTDFAGTARFSAVGVANSTRGFIGTGNIGGTWYGDVFEYDPSTDTWTFRGPAIQRTEATGFAINDQVYMGLGVANGNYLGTFRRLSPYWEVRKTSGDYDEYPTGNCFNYGLNYTGIWSGYAECPGSAPGCYAGFAVNTTQNLGNICYKSRVDASATIRGGFGWYGGNTLEDVRFCRRNLRVEFANQPTSPVAFRIFFTKAEIDALISGFNSSFGTTKTYSDLKLIKYSGPNQDLDPTNNSSNNSDYQQIIPTLTFYGSSNQFAYAEFNVSSYSEFYLGLTLSRRLYVNNNSLTGDVFTTAVGNDANPGTPSSPLLTIEAAISRANPGDSIFVDAGTYVTTSFSIVKPVTILGTNYLINPNDPGNALLPNTARNSESIITESTLTIAANNISLQGLTLDPGNRSAISLSNTSFGNLTFSRNKCILNSGNFISLIGTPNAGVAIPDATGFNFTHNRFEKLGTTSGITLSLGYINYVNIDQNSFVVTGPTPRNQVVAFIGSPGLVYDLRFTNNFVDRANHNLFTFQVAKAVISDNKFYNANNGLFFQGTYASSSDVLIENNYLESSMPAATFLVCRMFGGNNAGSTTAAKVRNNTINITATGLTTIPAAISTQMAGIALNPSMEVSGNKISHAGNYNLFTASNVIGISVNGKLENTSVANNELNFTGTNLVSPNPATPNALFTAGLQFSTDGGTTNPTPSGSVINVQNNKITGYKQSVALFDASVAAPNTYTGYGNVPAGVVFNINNNSFTGDSISINNGAIGEKVNATCNWYSGTDQNTVLPKVGSNATYSPWLVNGTDSDPSATGFQPVANSCSGYQKFYVNDNNLTGDVFTTAVGNDANSGSPSSPLATMTAALAKAQAGDTIVVDAGNYTEQVNIYKAITIRGAGKALTIINGPAAPIAALPDWGEKGIIQSIGGIGDVIVEHLLIDGTNSDELHSIMIQGGGRISNCEMRNANNGFFFRHISTQPRVALSYDNYIHNISFVGILYAGNGLTAYAYSNVIDLNGAIAGMGFITGWGGDGNVAYFHATNNTIINFNNFGMMIGSLQKAQVHNNSFTRLGGNYFLDVHNVGIDATCNWYGTTDPSMIIPFIPASVTYSPWLSNGTDNDPGVSFQPLPGVCNGRQNKFYVNDNSLTGDVYTTAVGNNANTGIPSSPFATIEFAFSKAQAGDSIIVDAGTYVMANLLVNKSITIVGTNHDVSPNNVTDKTVYNTARKAESRITGGTFTMAADWIIMNGLRFSSNAAISLNADHSHIKFDKNLFDVAGTSSTVSLQGVTSTPSLVAFDYSITDNRFERTDNGNGNGLFLGNVKSIWIYDNVFIESGPQVNRSFGIRTSNTQLVEGAYMISNYMKKLNQGVAPFIVKDFTVAGTQFDSCAQGVVILPGTMMSNNIGIYSNTFTNSRQGRNILVRGGSGGGINNLNISNNTINQSVNGINGIVSVIQLEFTAANNYGTTTVAGNKINLSGDYTQTNVGSNCGIHLTGKHSNTTIEKNELNFSAINHGTPLVATALPPVPAGVFIMTDGSATHGLIPSTAIINIRNNKISGFKQSVAIYDPAAGITPEIGYGYLTTGATLNINNNSFTGDSISIDNGNTSQPVNASCNWYGTAAAQNIVSKLSPTTVNYSPWLTDGTDSDIPTVGFQPSGTCNGTTPVISLDAFTHITCFGANNGSISISVSNGTSPYTYAWTKDEDEGFTSSSEDLAGLSPGTYHLTVTDANGSIVELEVTINEPALLTAKAGGSNNLCFDESNGTASVLVEGGIAPYSYLWNNNETTESITGLAAGIYSVTVTDANGCIATAQYEVTQPTQLTATAIGTSTSCANSATVNASGGTGGYRYLWSNGASTQSITSLPAGTYTVTVTDDNDCQITASCTVTAGEAFNPSASSVNVLCYGGNNGSITITNANATGPFEFSLDGVNFSSPQPMPFTFNNLTAGTYTVYVRDAIGCTGFISKTISQPAALTATLGTVQSTCFNQGTGSITVTVAGGTGGLTFSWTGPGYTSSQKNISGLAAGNYHFTVTDANGCSQTLNATVPSFEEIVVTPTVNHISCKGGSNGSISVAVSGGTGGFSYAWNTGSTSNSISSLGVGNYNVTITDIGSGCVVTRSYTITQPATLVNISTTKTNATGCASLGNITAVGSGGVSPYEYSLNGGQYQQSGSFGGLLAGNYTVTVKDFNGCTKTSAVLSITDNGSDEFEGNNSKNQAKPINLSTTRSARLAIATDIADWFRFTTTSAGYYKFTLTHPSASFTYNLYRSGNNTPAMAPVGSTSTSKTYWLGADSTFYISVTGGLSYVCYDFSIAPTTLYTRSVGSNPPVDAKEVQDVFDVKVFGNPTSTSFGLQAISTSTEKLMIRITDVSGRVIELRQNLQAGQVIRLGEQYRAGTYFAEVIQDNKRKVVKLIKL